MSQETDLHFPTIGYPTEVLMQAEQAHTGPKIRQGTDAAPAQVTQPTEVGQERTHELPFVLPSGCVVSPVVFRDPARVPPSSQFDLNGV